MAAQVVETYNLFLDTGRNLSNDSNGDIVNLPLGLTPIVAQQGQFIRLTLQEFHMTRSWLNINSTNNVVVLREPGGTAFPTTIPVDNYGSVYSLLLAFVGVPTPLSLGNFCSTLLLLPALTTNSISAITYINPLSPAETFDTNSLIIEFNITFTNPHTYITATAPIVQCFTNSGDSFLILGGDRINDTTDTTTNSWTTTVVSTTVLKFTAKNPAELSTQNHAYLRLNEQNTNIANTAFNIQSGDTEQTAMTSSTIMAIIPIQGPQVSYIATTDNVYSVNVLSKQITQLTVSLTDRTGRQFPLISTNQNNTGNRSFVCVIRVSILQRPIGEGILPLTPPIYTTQAHDSTAPSTMINRGIQAMGLNNPGDFYGSGFYGVDGRLRNPRG